MCLYLTNWVPCQLALEVLADTSSRPQSTPYRTHRPLSRHLAGKQARQGRPTLLAALPPLPSSLLRPSLSQTWLLSPLSSFFSLLHSNPFLPSSCNLVHCVFRFSVSTTPCGFFVWPPIPSRGRACCAATRLRHLRTGRFSALAPAAPAPTTQDLPAQRRRELLHSSHTPRHSQRLFCFFIPDAHPPRFDTINNLAAVFLLLMIFSPAAVPRLVSLSPQRV